MGRIKNQLAKIALFFKNKKRRIRAVAKGFTLIEVSLALVVAAVMLATVTMTVADAMRMQQESARYAVAVSLAQAKISQLLARPDLDVASESGEFGRDSGMYSGYKFKLDITREKLDITKITEEGVLSSEAPVEDLLPPDIQNSSDKKEEKIGAPEGDKMEILKIVVTIRYPMKSSEGIYTVSTFRSTSMAGGL